MKLQEIYPEYSNRNVGLVLSAQPSLVSTYLTFLIDVLRFLTLYSQPDLSRWVKCDRALSCRKITSFETTSGCLILMLRDKSFQVSELRVALMLEQSFQNP